MDAIGVGKRWIFLCVDRELRTDSWEADDIGLLSSAVCGSFRTGLLSGVDAFRM